MPKPYCIICEQYLTKEKSGVNLVEMYRQDSKSLWKPYKVWSADLHKCRRCGYEMLAGFGEKPFLEKHQENFERKYQSLKTETMFFVTD